MARFSLKRWWQVRHPGPWRVGLVVAEADQIPATIPSLQAALVVSDGMPKWLAFDCPCGTGHRVMLNLDRSRWPRWTVFAEAPLTISPSIDIERRERRCHYIVYHGHVNWVRNYGVGREHRSIGRPRRSHG